MQKVWEIKNTAVALHRVRRETNTTNKFSKQKKKIMTTKRDEISRALVAGDYHLAVSLLFSQYEKIDHRKSSHFHGCCNMLYYPHQDSVDAILTDLWECNSNVIGKFPKWSLPNGLERAIKEVQQQVVAARYPEAIKSDGVITEGMPIKMGENLFVFRKEEGNLHGKQVGITSYRSENTEKHVVFNFFPVQKSAVVAHYRCNLLPERSGIAFVVRSLSKFRTSIYEGFGYEVEGLNGDLKDIVNAFKKYNLNNIKEVVRELTPLHTSLEEVWQAITPDYRDVWYLPQVVAYYGYKHVDSMKKILPKIAKYSPNGSAVIEA